MHLLVRNTVKDFDTWVKVFREQESAGTAAGLELEQLWQSANDPNTAWFVFKVESRERADAFMAAPESAEAGRNSGVVDGEYHYLESVLG
jgi:hypothetical protein